MKKKISQDRNKERNQRLSQIQWKWIHVIPKVMEHNESGAEENSQN